MGLNPEQIRKTNLSLQVAEKKRAAAQKRLTEVDRKYMSYTKGAKTA